MNIINFTMPESGGFLVDIMIWLVNISSVAGGVILFTLLLKLITLPFDYISRASMRKNSVKMEEMRPELEKLQKQYADNKDLYNQKMMALYKKNGYSMFGACLPTILSLVIFIVAINGFNDYSQFQNQQYFYNMSLSYNSVVYSGFKTDDKYIVKGEDGKVYIDYEELVKTPSKTPSPVEVQVSEGHKIIYTDTVNADGSGKISVKTENGYIECVTAYTINDAGVRSYSNTPEYKVIEEELLLLNKDTVADYDYATEENNYLQIIRENEDGDDDHYLYSEVKDEEGMNINVFLNDIGQEKAAETYRDENSQFLWVKNIWVTDSPLKHPVESDWESFKSTHGYDGNDIEATKGYTNLIAKLEYEQDAPNGFFILVVLTAGSSLLMQIIMGKAQKAQMELQTVDGQGAQTQKIMKWMMPIMMAVFAFMYTAAFSIYIILSSVISMGTTFLINFIVDNKLKKVKAKEQSNSDGKVRGRIYVPKVEEKEPKKKKKDDKFAHEGGDFLSGTADKKKHVRGRIK